MNIASRLLFLVWILAGHITSAQSSIQLKEYRGIVREIKPGRFFAYSVMTIEVVGGLTAVNFPVEYGREIMNSFKPGDSISLRAKVRSEPMSAEALAQVRRGMAYIMAGQLVSIDLRGTWTDLVWGKAEKWNWAASVHLNQQIVSIYNEGSTARAVIFENGVVGDIGPYTSLNPLKGLRAGDRVSFIGMPFPLSEGAAYPLEGVKQVYLFQRLHRSSGTIQSLLFKQNYVCIGIAVNTERGEIGASFPTQYAQEVEKFADGRTVDIYLTDYKVKGQLQPPELHAIVSGRDSLFIKEIAFYGGADGKHDYAPVTFQGKITAINRSEAGRILGLIIGDHTFVEIDANTARQLGNVLRRGKLLEVTGDQRVKKAGEIYSKDYDIVLPHQIKIDGKVFLITTRP